MFLRRQTKSARGVGCSDRHLCETARTARGPRQRVVASLGKFDEADVRGMRGGWDDLRSLLRGEPAPAETADLPGLGAVCAPESAARWERVDVSGLRVERTRDFDESDLALSLWRSLEQGMRSKGLGGRARQLVKEVAKINSVDVILPVLRGAERTELRLRVVATPEPATAQLLAHLGLRLPIGPRVVAHVVPKIGT